MRGLDSSAGLPTSTARDLDQPQEDVRVLCQARDLLRLIRSMQI